MIEYCDTAEEMILTYIYIHTEISKFSIRDRWVFT